MSYARPMTDVVERYLMLGLRLGRHVDGLVDSYYGPPELAAAVNAEEPLAAADLVAQAEALATDLERAGLDDAAPAVARGSGSGAPRLRRHARRREPLVRRRGRRLLRRQAGAGIGGRLPRGSRAARRAAPRSRPARRARPALARGACRGAGPHGQRRSPRSPTDCATAPVASSTCPWARSSSIEEVHDEPWWAFNYYLGDLRSRVVMNVDQLTTASDLVMLAAHEAYPGHHTERVVKEQLLVRDRGFAEESIQLVPTPQSLVSEGIAETASSSCSIDELEQELDALLAGHGLDADLERGSRDRPRPAAAPERRARRRPDRPRTRRLDRRGASARRAMGARHGRAGGAHRALRDRPDLAGVRDHLLGGTGSLRRLRRG